MVMASTSETMRPLKRSTLPLVCGVRGLIWRYAAPSLQGNRLNRLCNEHPDQVLVIPPCALAAKAERLLSRRAADQVLRHVPDGGEVGRGVGVPDATLVVAEGHVHDPVQAVLDAPVIPDGGSDPPGIGSERGDV